MGGPWRDRGFDPRAWRAPVAARASARVETLGSDGGSDGPDPLTGIVVGYIAATLTSVGVVLILLRNDW